jgi:hypothetical protein
MIPEGLARELASGRRHEPGQRRRAIPVGEAEFADGTDGPVDGGQQQVLSDGEPLVALGQMAIEEFDESDLLSAIREGDDVADGGDLDGLGLRGRALPLVQGGRDQIVGRASVDGADDLRLAVDALAFAGIGIGLAVNDLAVRLAMRLRPLIRRSYKMGPPMSSEIVRWFGGAG